MTPPRRIAWHVLAGLGVLVGIIVVYAVLMSATTTTDVRETQQVNTKKADARDQALALVRDCVTPGGKCFQRGKEQTAEAVSAVAANNALSAAAAASCAVSHPRAPFAVIYACTTKRVASATRRAGG